MNGILQNIRYAGRQLRNSPGFATVAVVTLALGIGANTALSSVVSGVLIRRLLYSSLEADVAYWTAVQPHLAPGWWNRDLQNMRQLDNERSHYTGDLRSLEGLVAIGFTPARSSIARFCNTWSKVPPLDANSTVDQISEQCQTASKRLPTD